MKIFTEKIHLEGINSPLTKSKSPIFQVQNNILHANTTINFLDVSIICFYNRFRFYGQYIRISRMYVENAKPQGIVVAGEVNITSGPGSQYVTEFTLHNGAEVQIVETRANWIRLAVPNSELQGWAPAPAVEAVTGSIS